MLQFDFTTYTEGYLDKEKLIPLYEKYDTYKQKLKEQEMIGFLEPTLTEEHLQFLEDAAGRIKEMADFLLVIGIGGSSLGCQALEAPLKSYFSNDGLEIIYVGHHLSSQYLCELLDYIKDKRICVNVISKSGTTLEPMLVFQEVLALLKEKYNATELSKRVFVTTDKEKGLLKEMALKYHFETFVVPSNIGGRYSVLTDVGLLPLATKLDIRALLIGAANAKCYEKEAFLYACYRQLFYQAGLLIENLVVYEPSFLPFAEWWKQLFAESEGKNKGGIFPVSTLNTRDLHSLGQFLQEGTPIVFETVLRVTNPKADLLLQEQKRTLHSINQIILTSVQKAHAKVMPNLLITIDSICEESIGELVYFFFLAASYSSLLFDVNPFNQPGVEVYKEEVRQNLSSSSEQ